MEYRDVLSDDFAEAGEAGSRLKQLADNLGVTLLTSRTAMENPKYPDEYITVDSVYFARKGDTTAIELRHDGIRESGFQARSDCGVADALRQMFRRISIPGSILENVALPLEDRIFLKAREDGQFQRMYPKDKAGFYLSETPVLKK